MEKMQKKPEKKDYEKPKVIFERTLEVLAGVCDPPYGGIGTCKASSPCTNLNS